jgi:hypothetical protein
VASIKSTALASVIIFILSLVTFGVSAFLDPEPHHDGVQMAPAIAVSEGLAIHRDVFDQYGPITAWLQGGAVYLFGPQLLTIRLMTAVFLAVAAVLMLLIAREFFRTLSVPILLTVLWVSLWPGRSVEALTYLFLPWPSITFLVLQLAASLITIRIVRGSTNQLGMYALLGMVTGTAVITRLNYGLPLALAVIVVLLIFRNTKGPIGRSRWLTLVLSAAVPILIVVIVLVHEAAIGAYSTQTITGPLAGEATEGSTPWFFIKNVVLWGSLPLLITIATVYAAARRWPRSRKLPITLGSFGTLGLIVWVSASIPNTPLRELILHHLTWAPALDHLAFQPLFLIALIIPIACVGVIIMCAREISDKIRMIGATLFIAGASMAQLFPFIDPNHLWWASPLMLIAFSYLISLGLSNRWRNAVLAVLCLPPLVIAVPRAIEYLAIPRQQLNAGVLSGMFIPVERVKDVKLVDDALLGLSVRSNRFDCINGLFAVWNGTYLADSAGFVNWATGVAPLASSDIPAIQVVCAPVSGDGTIGLFDVPAGMEVKNVSGPISVSYYNYMYLVTLVPAAQN